MNVVLLDESFKLQLLELISPVAAEHVLPQLEAAGRVRYLAKLLPDIENCFASDTGRYVGINCNGSLVGACGFSTEGHIAQLFVRTSEQARGIGTMLLNQAVSQLPSILTTAQRSLIWSRFHAGNNWFGHAAHFVRWTRLG